MARPGVEIGPQPVGCEPLDIDGGGPLMWDDALVFPPREAICAPFAGIVTVLAEPGARIDPGQPLVVIEALKMEAAVTADSAGYLVEVVADSGTSVGGGDVVLYVVSDVARWATSREA